MSPSTPAAPTRLLSVAQAAERLSTTASALYELVASQVIASVRIGRTIRIPEAALHRLQNEPAEHLAQPERATDLVCV
jgi:excisionase family DNA binding protein